MNLLDVINKGETKMNMKTLGALLVGGVILISGCHQQATPKQETAQQKPTCNYTQVEKLGSYSASNPLVDTNKLFSFNGTTFDNKQLDVDENGNKIVKAIVIRKDHVAMYEVNVATFDSDGWGTLENKNNVYQVDEVVRERVPAYELGNLSRAENAMDMVDVTFVKAHGVHVHKGCDK